MRSSLKRFIVIAVILAISILLGFIVDIVWKGFEKKAHPNTYLEYVRQYAYEYNIPEPVIFAMIKVERAVAALIRMVPALISSSSGRIDSRYRVRLTAIRDFSALFCIR